jgi:hypothetical protein
MLIRGPLTGLALAIGALLLHSACSSARASRVRWEDLYTFPGILDIEELPPTEAPETSLADAIAQVHRRIPDAQLLDARLGRIRGELNCYARFWEAGAVHVLDVDLARDEVGLELSKVSMSPKPSDQQALENLMHGLADPAAAVATAAESCAGSWARAVKTRQGTRGPEYAVELVSGSVVREVCLCARSGELLPDAPRN